MKRNYPREHVLAYVERCSESMYFLSMDKSYIRARKNLAVKAVFHVRSQAN
jgi:hypothetical protein